MNVCVCVCVCVCVFVCVYIYLYIYIYIYIHTHTHTKRRFARMLGAALSYMCMRPYATSASGLKLVVYQVIS